MASHAPGLRMQGSGSEGQGREQRQGPLPQPATAVGTPGLRFPRNWQASGGHRLFPGEKCVKGVGWSRAFLTGSWQSRPPARPLDVRAS